jgi:hypothetical protein
VLRASRESCLLLLLPTTDDELNDLLAGGGYVEVLGPPPIRDGCERAGGTRGRDASGGSSIRRPSRINCVVWYEYDLGLAVEC